ncbi:hypothetical protein WH47_05381 [Habropoda laboriosa]|uniref:Uncharacterized protein n=1 Tax=Habropoda laboriosa TaxID=597456 RepID=A0A0L7RKJ1_9HYME|nr:hypothetical protein WH47_05381 [Habropoda laboriosa]
MKRCTASISNKRNKENEKNVTKWRKREKKTRKKRTGEDENKIIESSVARILVF